MSLLPKQYGKQGWWDDNRFIWGIGITLIIAIMFLVSLFIDFVADKTSDSYHAFKNRKEVAVVKRDKEYRHIYNTEKKYVIPEKKIEKQKVQKETMLHDEYGNLKDPIYNDSLDAGQTYWVLLATAIFILCWWGTFFMGIHPIITIFIYVFGAVLGIVIWFW